MAHWSEPRRASGILLHPTSLPGHFGVGDVGAGADHFLHFLARAGQALWQVLPLTPTGYGDSPYAAPSAFAGNPLLVDLQRLLDDRLLVAADVAELRTLPTDRADFTRLIPLRTQALRAAYARLGEGGAPQRASLAAFRHANAGWLEDFVLFTALREAHGTPWTEWPAALRDRDADELVRVRTELHDELAYHAFVQLLFAEHWADLRARAARLGIRIMGDIPIFVAHDSVDVWANRQLFKLEPAGWPRVVAGVPPDYFSATGQLWGNPLYDWDALAAVGYGWWIDRFRHMLGNVDLIRIDHFRGFQAAWEVPAGATTAIGGTWVAGPGIRLFQAVDAALGGVVPVVAEDLGLITDEVHALLRATGYPGMKVLQFAFGDGVGRPNPYLPHGYRDPNYVVYTGTHDNDTTRGWYRSAPPDQRQYVQQYIGRPADTADAEIVWDVIRLALASVADTSVVPLQDVLCLGSAARMNTPGAAEGNWSWRVRGEELTPEGADRLAALTHLYGRSSGAPRYP